MTPTIPETTLHAAPPDTTAQPKATTKPNNAPRKPRVAAVKAKSANKTTSSKKAPKPSKAVKRAKTAKPGARQGSKAEKVLALLRRPNGGTLAELIKATGWQKHSVRGFLSGTVGKRMGLKLESVKKEGGERTYSVKA